MDDRRFGLAIRALRRRLGWRQHDLALRAHVRQQDVSDMERGRVQTKRLESIRRVTSALGAGTALDLQWRGGALDRLVDQRHAELVERVAAVLGAAGWQVRPEVSFAIGGDRGSIDLLAWNADLRAVLIVEIKTELTSVEETLRRLDVKERLAGRIVAETLGWRPEVIGVALVLPETSTARRRVADHQATFVSRLPQTGRDVRAWLRAPATGLRAVWFLSEVPTVGGKRVPRGPDRIRVPKSPPPVPTER